MLWRNDSLTLLADALWLDEHLTSPGREASLVGAQRPLGLGWLTRGPQAPQSPLSPGGCTAPEAVCVHNPPLSLTPPWDPQTRPTNTRR